MKLDLESIKDLKQFKDADIIIPSFDIEALHRQTKAKPEWLHFGGGNIFRVFIAATLQKAIEEGKCNTGIIVAETYDFEIIDRYYRMFDNLSLSVIMNADGTYNKQVIATIAETLKCEKNSSDYLRLKQIVSNCNLKLLSLTITEKGYALQDYDGKYYSNVLDDIKNGPDNPSHVMSILTALLFERFKVGQLKLAVVSMDNCSRNGDKLKSAIIDIAEKWKSNGFVDQSFINYISDDRYISFPYTMIDKITPRPSEDIKQILEGMGIEDMDIIITNKGSYTAPFVNSESSEYLIIEDKFPNGKIDISNERVIFTDRETVNNVEVMKVTTCLNPIHTTLAVAGCLLGYTLISEAMKDETILKLARRIGYDEGMKVVVDPKIISPLEFLDECMNERFVNPFILDTPQRIAMDTSQKVGIRFGETIKAYEKSDKLDVKDLVGIKLVLALWCRYLVGIDDKGVSFDISRDSQSEQLNAIFGSLSLGDSINIKDFLSNERIFGIDLNRIGLGRNIQNYFDEMILQKGAVRATIDKYVSDAKTDN